MHFLATLRIDIFLWLNWVIVESNTILNAFYGNYQGIIIVFCGTYYDFIVIR